MPISTASAAVNGAYIVSGGSAGGSQGSSGAGGSGGNGGSTDAIITGTAGEDTITGGSGSNELFGLGGNDVFIVESDDSATANRIWDFRAGDKILLQTSGVATSTVEVDTVLSGAAVSDYDGDGNSDDTRIVFPVRTSILSTSIIRLRMLTGR